MLLKIALNGARSKSENEFIPHSISEIEKEVKSVFEYGFRVFHIHCYGKNGRESLKPEDIDNHVSAVKNISPDILLGISTADWIEPDLNKRLDYILNWNLVPDFASVNMIEENAHEVSDALIKKGVQIEAGLNERKASENFIKIGIEKHCCRILIEPEDETFNTAVKTVSEIEDVLDSNGINLRRLLHGFNSASWDILREAKKRGYDSRTGMEDTIYLESGKKVTSNVEIIKEAIKIWNASSKS